MARPWTRHDVGLVKAGLPTTLFIASRKKINPWIKQKAGAEDASAFYVCGIAGDDAFESPHDPFE